MKYKTFEGVEYVGWENDGKLLSHDALGRPIFEEIPPDHWTNEETGTVICDCGNHLFNVSIPPGEYSVINTCVMCKSSFEIYSG